MQDLCSILSLSGNEDLTFLVDLEFQPFWNSEIHKGTRGII